MMGYPEKSTVIFVHGAWADGSSWGTVINSVADAGLRTICAPIPLTSLSNDIAALRRSIDHADGPCILLGHAYAGAVIGGVDHDSVKALVYITALAPDEGETVADIFYREVSHPDAPKLAPDSDGYIWMPHEGFSKAFAPHAKSEELVRLEAIQRPIHVACIQEKAPAPAWTKIPAWYLVAEEDRMILESNQRFMAQRMNATIKNAAVDHTPSITDPSFVVDIVLEAAKATLVPEFL